MIHLLSYNILFGKQLDKIIPWLNQLEKERGHFDILCFQEFPQQAIDRFLHQRKKNPTDYRFAPTIFRQAEPFGQLTVFSTNKINLLKSNTLHLGTSRLENGVLKLFRRATRRKSLVTFFKIGRHQPLIIANTHLTCISLNGHRRGQLSKILTVVNQANTGLIVGDMNYTSALPRYRLRRLLKKHCFQNMTPRLKTHRVLGLKHQLDYIFAKGVRIKTVATADIPFSDHYPLLAEFEV